MLEAVGGGTLAPTGGALSNPNPSGPAGVVVVDSHPGGYWIDSTTQRGYPELNGIYVRKKQKQGADGLAYENLDTAAVLKWVPQGWLLQLAQGTDCFLQMSGTQLMVMSRGWMAIDHEDIDPLAEPPDEVVALLDEGALKDLIASKRAHDEAVRRSRAPLLLPTNPPADGAWWRVLHRPVVIVRAAPALDAPVLGHKLTGERVYGISRCAGRGAMGRRCRRGAPPSWCAHACASSATQRSRRRSERTRRARPCAPSSPSATAGSPTSFIAPSGMLHPSAT